MVAMEMDKMRALGAYLRQLREDCKVTKADLAEWLGCEYERIDEFESCPERLELVFVLEVAAALDQDPAEVLQSCAEILRSDSAAPDR